MLYITIPKGEYFDEEKEEFINIGPWTLQLEHSLVSVSKWEAKHQKAFLGRQEKTEEELIDYIRCMTINKVSDNSVYNYLSVENYYEINEYINNKMSATTISNVNKAPSRDIITSEVIYYWMVSFQIPFECQKWHLNRLLTLIEVCNVKNNPPKKIPKSELFSRNRALNEARKKGLM